jgi:hypothetical protein
MNLMFAALFGVIFSLGLAVATALLYSLPVMWLWNAFAPDIFGVRPLTWAQALWLSLLCGLLFGTTSSTTTKTS